MRDDEVGIGEALLLKSAGEVVDTAEGVTQELNEESELEVALLVEVLDALLVKSVVLDAGELPRGVLDANIGEIVEEGGDGLVDVVTLHTSGSGAASLVLLELDGGPGGDIGGLSGDNDLITVVIDDALDVVDLVKGGGPSLHVPLIGGGEAAVGVEVGVGGGLEVPWDDGHGVVSLHLGLIHDEVGGHGEGDCGDDCEGDDFLEHIYCYNQVSEACLYYIIRERCA